MCSGNLGVTELHLPHHATHRVPRDFTQPPRVDVLERSWVPPGAAQRAGPAHSLRGCSGLAWQGLVLLARPWAHQELLAKGLAHPAVARSSSLSSPFHLIASGCVSPPFSYPNVAQRPPTHSSLNRVISPGTAELVSDPTDS